MRYQGAERTRTAVGNRSEKPPHSSTFDGFWLFLALVALTAAIIPFGYWAALGLLVLVVLTPARGKR